MSIVGFPLLLIPLAICNIIVFLMPGLGFDVALTSLALPSGRLWSIALGDAVVALAALLLLLEVIKAGRPGGKYVTDQLLSLLVFAGTVAEFVMLPQFGNATMFLLSILALVDFLAGIALRNRQQRAPLRRSRSKDAPPQPDPKPAAVAEAPVAAAEPVPATTTAAETPVSPSASAASIAEAVLLDRPQPVAPAIEVSPRIQSPGLQPGQDASAGASR
ncbi:hypothetical protein [Rhodopseudomonas sp. B29]|uniref:hypothetical protein n=1 Tax=Rhodopseudomonas sp. B29 TaxID=95607 RepID=UPI0003B4C074|nr:hypothetical protein [Rhodopseudomonas sp. B29]